MNKEQFVSVGAFLPFWRYAVGPASGSCPAIPFWTRAGAEGFFKEAKRILPWSGCLIYKRRFFNGIETIKEYTPNEA